MGDMEQMAPKVSKEVSLTLCALASRFRAADKLGKGSLSSEAVAYQICKMQGNALGLKDRVQAIVEKWDLDGNGDMPLIMHCIARHDCS